MMAASVYPASLEGVALKKGRNAMDVILHVGAHLSGVSTLASYLNRNRRPLEAHGLKVWTPEVTRKGLFDGLTLKSGLDGVARRRARGAGRGQLRCAMVERQRVRELLGLEPHRLLALIPI